MASTKILIGRRRPQSGLAAAARTARPGDRTNTRPVATNKMITATPRGSLAAFLPVIVDPADDSGSPPWPRTSGGVGRRRRWRLGNEVGCADPRGEVRPATR